MTAFQTRLVALRALISTPPYTFCLGGSTSCQIFPGKPPPGPLLGEMTDDLVSSFTLVALRLRHGVNHVSCLAPKSWFMQQIPKLDVKFMAPLHEKILYLLCPVPTNKYLQVSQRP